MRWRLSAMIAHMDKTAFEVLSGIYPQEISFLSQDEPFRFLASVMLSAQTRDVYVNAVTPVLWSRYPTPQALSEAQLEDIEEIIHSLGFYHSKARNLKALATEVSRLGYVPSTIQELVKLPGVGRKTANCYVNHILQEPAVIVDTHFARVARRLGYADSEDPVQLEMQIRGTFPPEDWSRLSMVLNLHGRRYCHARKPECDVCPVRDYCSSR